MLNLCILHISHSQPQPEENATALKIVWFTLRGITPALPFASLGLLSDLLSKVFTGKEPESGTVTQPPAVGAAPSGGTTGDLHRLSKGRDQ